MAISVFSKGARAAAVTSVVVTSCIASSLSVPANASSPTTPAEINESAAFAARELERGASNGTEKYLVPGVTGAADIGLTMDYLYILDALGGHDELVDASYSAVQQRLDSYLVFDGETDSNRLSKVVALENTLGKSDSGRINTLAISVQQDGKVMNTRDGAGSSAMTNFGQAWAVIALEQSGKSAEAERAAQYLADQICPDGGIPLSQSSNQCGSVDPDSTALAAQALALTLGSDDSHTKSAVQFLRNNMGQSGGITSRYAGINSNTTALAAGAFQAVDDVDSFAKAHRFLDSTRFGASAGSELRGAFAHQSAHVATTSSLTDQVRRATGQAALAFAGFNYVGSEQLLNFGAPANPQPQPRPDAQESSAGSPVTIALGLIGGVAAVIALLAFLMNSSLPFGF